MLFSYAMLRYARDEQRCHTLLMPTPQSDASASDAFATR
jgi:hypothetical protein